MIENVSVALEVPRSVHVYNPGEGADNPLGPKYFHEHKSFVHLLIPTKFSDIK